MSNTFYFSLFLGRSGPLMDIAFLVDGSFGSRPQFNTIKNLVKSFVSTLDVGKHKVHIGMIEYGNNARIVLPFDSLNNVQSINQFIDTIRPSGGAPRLDRALAKTKDIFTIERGYRPGVSKVAILVANSKYGGRDIDLQQAVQELRKDGVRVYVIASNTPDQQRLQTLAAKEDITRVTRFFGAGKVVTQLAKYIGDKDKGNWR